MLILTYSGALIRSELTQLDAVDANETVQSIRISRKGGETQEIPIGSLAMSYLSTYIHEIRPLLNPKCDAMFVSSRGKRIMPSAWQSNNLSVNSYK